MTVYVYHMKHQARIGARTSDPWFDVTADTQDELHDFAARLGIPRQGFQPGELVGPLQVSVTWHYTVTSAERDRAVLLGAQAISSRDVAKIEQPRAAEAGAV
jgi:hypothetical protein